MGEENKSGTDESTEEQSDDAEQNDSGSEEENTDDNSDDGTDDSGDAGDGDDDDDVEPAIRKKTSKDYIIERKNKKIEKLKNKKEQDDDDDDSSDEEDDDVSPEDEAVVDKIIRKNYGEKFAKLDESEDKAEMKTFLADNPDFKSFEKKIWKFWQHPSRNHLPIQSVAYEVAGPALLRIGAKRGTQADDKAKKSSSGGNTSRNAGGKVDYSAMSDAEFNAHVEKVKRGRE